jgi:hypothetical protein
VVGRLGLIIGGTILQQRGIAVYPEEEKVVSKERKNFFCAGLNILKE